MRSLPTFLTLLCLIGAAPYVLAQAGSRAGASSPGGYQIEVRVAGFEGTEAYLANYFMDKQYIVDTADFVDGKAVFRDTGRLKEGMYLLVLPPDNDYAQILIDGDQEFSLSTDMASLTTSMRVQGSEENERFFTYLQLLDRLRPQADSLRRIVADSTLTQNERDAASALVEQIDARVVGEQERIRTSAPNSILASLLRSFQEPEMPEFTGTPEEVQKQQYLYYKEHYFDNVDLGDPRSLRSTYLDQKLTYYLDKLVVPAPDSINKELDYLLGEMAAAPETFRAYVSKYLNQYAGSKIVGQDAVYAHLGEKYYMTDATPWIDSTTKAKIAENVLRLKPLLIGQPAPALTTYRKDNTPVNLYGIDAAYTVLFFFDPECGVCKKQTPEVISFANDYADQGVKVMTVCTKLGADGNSCWEYVAEKEGMAEALINTNDPFHRSRFKISYDVTSTPQVYVLDRDKRIVSKRIAGEQLREVVDQLLEIKAADVTAN